MATYALTVSTNALGLGVINGATVRIEKRRVSIADTYPPVNNLIQVSQATNVNGIATFLLEPDDLTTHHVAKIFDLAGVFIYQKSFTMPPSASNLHDSSISTVIGGSLIQFKENGNDLGTPTTVRNVDIIGTGATATFSGNTVTIEIKGSTGFVAITDITPTNPSDNVGNIKYVPDTDDTLIASCVSSTNNITVQVMAVTAGDVFKPVVDVNGVQATLTRNVGTDVWVGTAAIALVGDTITATHNAGAIDTATVTIEAAPVITSLTFSGAYSQGEGQTEHAASQKLGLNIVTDTPIVAVQVIDDSSTATLAYTESFTATTSKSITVTTANRGNTPTAYPAKVRVQNANGTWSVLTTSSNTIILNNSTPTNTFAKAYPDGQLAIKAGEQATVTPTATNTDTMLWEVIGAELVLVDPANTVGAMRVAYDTGTYNVTTANLRMTATKTSNAKSAVFTTVVYIAEEDAVLSASYPAAKLRSSSAGIAHTVTVVSSQLLLTAPVLACTKGSIGAVAESGLSYSTTITVNDAVVKGTGVLSATVNNLAGKPVSISVATQNYLVAGFTQRTINLPVGAKEVDLGTTVYDTAKVQLSVNGLTGQYNNSLANFIRVSTSLVTEFAVTSPSNTLNATGNLIYLNEGALTSSNTVLGSVQVIVEEIV